MRVIRLLESGEPIVYDAIVHVINREGRTVLEQVRSEQAALIAQARVLFVAAADVPIIGWPDYYAISGFLVRMFPYIARRSNAAKMIDLGCAA